MDTGQNDLPKVSPFILSKRNATAAATERSSNVWFSLSCLLTNSRYRIVTIRSRACLSFTLSFVQPAHLYTAAAGEHVSVEQIVAVFNASTRQKAWDHFSKAQRKNIDIWRKHSEELRNAHSEQLMGIRREEEMEMSDDDSGDNPSKKLRVDDSAAQAYALKEENDSLRWQLDAYRNEVELLKQEKGQLFRTEESLTKDQQLQFLQQTMQGMQQVLLRKKRTGLLF
ncbi:PREDICTED: ecto-NOX disulfide-thiol exchanger 1 [Cariama cristata]|uniref:ecto-NOX disulfide-thiol exchanger 1 n=1 Tax=Cariama cristata TaxID=54380 RepID=UPI000520B6D6|nr:PREDICTED: ecto-NOX disulfide-thiol exchanger 1 [Cariama cristata]